MAKGFAKGLGAVLALVGFLGFMPQVAPDGMLLGVFMVNALHNLIHVLSGVILLGAGIRAAEDGARTTVLAFGLIYGLVTVLGFAMGGDILGLLTVNPADNLLHAVITVACLAVGLRKARPTTVPV